MSHLRLVLTHGSVNNAKSFAGSSKPSTGSSARSIVLSPTSDPPSAHWSDSRHWNQQVLRIAALSHAIAQLEGPGALDLLEEAAAERYLRARQHNLLPATGVSPVMDPPGSHRSQKFPRVPPYGKSKT